MIPMSPGALMHSFVFLCSAPGGGAGAAGGHFTASAADGPNEFGAFNSLRDDGRPPTLQERLASEYTVCTLFAPVPLQDPVLRMRTC